jgi:hypothetical protein
MSQGSVPSNSFTLEMGASLRSLAYSSGGSAPDAREKGNSGAVQKKQKQMHERNRLTKFEHKRTARSFLALQRFR